MQIKDRSPEQWANIVGMLGAADSLFRDLAEKPDTNGLFRRMLAGWAQEARDLQAEITEQFNGEKR